MSSQWTRDSGRVNRVIVFLLKRHGRHGLRRRFLHLVLVRKGIGVVAAATAIRVHEMLLLLLLLSPRPRGRRRRLRRLVPRERVAGAAQAHRVILASRCRCRCNAGRRVSVTMRQERGLTRDCCELSSRNLSGFSFRVQTFLVRRLGISEATARMAQQLVGVQTVRSGCSRVSGRICEDGQRRLASIRFDDAGRNSSAEQRNRVTLESCFQRGRTDQHLRLHVSLPPRLSFRMPVVSNAAVEYESLGGSMVPCRSTSNTLLHE